MRVIHVCLPSALAALLLSAVPGPSSAALVQFKYAGTVRQVALLSGHTDDLGFAVGQRVSGSFVVDTAVADVESASNRALLPWSIRQFLFSSHSADIGHLNYSYFGVNSDPSLDYVQSYALAIDSSVSHLFTFGLESPGPTALLGSDTPDLLALKLQDFDLLDSRFEYRRIETSPTGLRSEVLISAGFESMTVHTIPEPRTAFLASLSMAGLLLIRRFSSMRAPRITSLPQ